MHTTGNTRKQIKAWLEALPFIGIGLVLVCVFVFYPLVKNIFISLTEYSIMPNAENKFIGLQNYFKIFYDEKLGYAMRNSLLMVIITVPIQMFLGLILSCLINAIDKGKNFFRTTYYIPVITSWVVVSYMFKYIFAGGKGGLFNYVFMNIGILKQSIPWFQQTWTALTVIWILSIWKGVGWCMVVYLAGLQGIPKNLYEQSSIDGANPYSRFFNITLPLLTPITFYILINLTIGAFNSFIQTYILTGGAPMNTTHVMMSLMYQRAFQNFEFGISSAMSVIQGIIILVIVAIQRKYLNKMQYEY